MVRGFHTFRGGTDPGDVRCRPRVIGVVEMSKDFPSGDGNLSLFGGAGPLRWPERQLSPRTGSMSPSKSAITQWGWGFHTVRGGIDPSDLCFCTGVIELKRYGSISRPGMCGVTVTLTRGATLAAGSTSLIQSPTSQWGWRFQTLWGGIDPGDLRFCPRVVGVVELLTDS